MFIVLDLESSNREIIEIGAVKVDLFTRKISNEFSILVRPKLPLQEEVAALTGITNEEIKKAVLFNEAYYKFVKYCGSKNTTILAAWGFDFLEIQQQIRNEKLPYKLTNEFCNISRLFREKYGTRKLSLEDSLRFLGLEFEGKPHRALPDAFNTAKLLLEVFKV